MLCPRLLHMPIILLIPTWLVLRPNWLVPRPTIRLRVTLLLLRAGRLAHTPTSIRTARLQLVVHVCLLQAPAAQGAFFLEWRQGHTGRARVAVLGCWMACSCRRDGIPGLLCAAMRCSLGVVQHGAMHGEAPAGMPPLALLPDRMRARAVADAGRRKDGVRIVQRQIQVQPLHLAAARGRGWREHPEIRATN